MRLWTIHPQHLDAKGLVALWREGLLAQAVLAGKTHGYRNHPQLLRFRRQSDPLGCLAAYLSAVCREAERRGYAFDVGKITAPPTDQLLEETQGQLNYEWQHLLRKLEQRDPERYRLSAEARPLPHPLFSLIPGPVQDWEKSADR